MLQNKPYFIITTNVDGQFLQAGFDQERVFEVQGTLSKIQCAVGCHNTLYDDLNLLQEMLEQEKDCKIPSSSIPHCPVCGDKMEVNIRKDAFFVEDDHWATQYDAYRRFIKQNQDKKILLLELGVGFNKPGIICYPFEELTYHGKDIRFVRINDTYLDVPYEILDKAIIIKEDGTTAIKPIEEVTL